MIHGKYGRVLGMVLAGGKGERLMPLTKYRAKPAVPFAAKYRIIDFSLSNMVNSGLFSIYCIQHASNTMTVVVPPPTFSNEEVAQGIA